MRYEGPGEIISDPGRDYGPLWEDEAWAVVMHTTETPGLPGYRDKTITPNITIDPRRRRVYTHVDLDRRCGALRGSNTVFKETGIRVPMNEKAIQIELICYSDKRIADQSASRTWVGDLTDEDLEFIAQVVAWVVKRVGRIGRNVTPQPPSGWRYGLGSKYRGSAKEWDEFSGITAHGWVFGQKHWDTGVLDLVRLNTRVWEIIDGEEDMTPEQAETLEFFGELKGQIEESGGNSNSLFYGLQFYRWVASHYGISGADPLAVARRLLAEIEKGGAPLPAEEVVRLIRADV